MTTNIHKLPSTDNVSDTLTESAPSISSSAMLVELSISTWTGRKLDKQASQVVTTTNNASSGVANVHKKLLGDCAELDMIQKFVAPAWLISCAARPSPSTHLETRGLGGFCKLPICH